MTKNKLRKKAWVIGFGIVVVVALIVGIVLSGGKLKAATMRLTSYDGEVEPETNDILRVPETVVDGIVHHEYYEVELENATEEWISELIEACESGDNEKAAMLTGYDSQYQEELIKIGQQLERLSTYDLESETCRFFYDDYKCCLKIYGPNRRGLYHATVYLLVQDGMGYAVRSSMGFSASEGVSVSYNPNWSVFRVPCVNGMYNGNYTGETIWIYRNVDDDTFRRKQLHYVVTGNLSNGLEDGDCRSEREDYTETSSYDHGVAISGVKIYSSGKEEPITFKEDYLYFLEGSAEPKQTEKGLEIYPY